MRQPSSETVYSDNGRAVASLHAQSYETHEDRWAAVVGRDREANEHFVYSVASTGIYCLPSCPSRLPKEANVCFFRSASEAESKGFRPCKRCQPDAATRVSSKTMAIQQACRVIEASEEEPDFESLAQTAGISRFHFQRVFKEVTGVTPRSYFLECRTRRVQKGLREADTVTETIYNSGFNSSGRFYANTSEMLGMTPVQYREGGKAMAIRFAVGECSLGSILVAGTEKGICSILLGDDAEQLIADLERNFGQAELIGGDPKFEAWVANVIGYIENPALGLDLPLDIRGTAFQRRVWLALRAIPAGSTVSYEQLAERLGMKKAVRAVARACASNALAVAIPCHRVIRKDGGLSGYRWGVQRKEWLLKREAIKEHPE